MTGAGLASLIERMVTALNSREIPSAGSMLEFFNKEVRPSWRARDDVIRPEWRGVFAGPLHDSVEYASGSLIDGVHGRSTACVARLQLEHSKRLVLPS
jgi:hypothetical protein